MRTTLVIGIVVIFSQVLSIAFFWQNLYLPEILQHAHTTAIKLERLHTAEKQGVAAADIDSALMYYSNINVVRDPAQFPTPKEKWFAELFTDRFARQLKRELQYPAQVYFEFRPTPAIWIKANTAQPVWLKENLYFMEQYSPGIIAGWVFGVPLLSIMAIVILARQLNRPLKRLQLAAIRVGRGQHSTELDNNSGPIEIRAVNRAFNQMSAQIQQAETERTVMLAGISHDLRTPLTRLRLTAEMLPDRELAEGIITDVADMDSILEQFIAFMRDGSEEVQEICSLNKLIEEVSQVAGQQCEIRCQLATIPDLSLRRVSIKRLIDNLIQNALRYGKPPIDISTRLESYHVVMTVRDHGSGIDAGQGQKLLDPFYRGESSRTQQGSGLGLAIVARIARQHRGQIQLSNHPDGGLEVTLRLPRPRVWMRQRNNS